MSKVHNVAIPASIWEQGKKEIAAPLDPCTIKISSCFYIKAKTGSFWEEGLPWNQPDYVSGIQTPNFLQKYPHEVLLTCSNSHNIVYHIF